MESLFSGIQHMDVDIWMLKLALNKLKCKLRKDLFL